MYAVYKYPILPDEGVTIFKANKIIKPLAVQHQYDDFQIFLWALVDLDSEQQDYTMIALGTGHEVIKEIDKAIFVNTLQTGPFVYHYFLMNPSGSTQDE